MQLEALGDHHPEEGWELSADWKAEESGVYFGLVSLPTGTRTPYLLRPSLWSGGLFSTLVGLE